MANGQNPADLQIVAPAVAPAAEPTPQTPEAVATDVPAPKASDQFPVAEPKNMEDRILSVEEVETVFRSMGSDPAATGDSAQDAAIADLFSPGTAAQAVTQAQQQVADGQTPPELEPAAPVVSAPGVAPVAPAVPPLQTQAVPPAFATPLQQIPVQTQPSQREALLEAQVTALQQNVQQLSQLSQQRAQPVAQPVSGVPGSDLKQVYAELQNVNPQISMMLADENPANRHAALQTLVGGLAEQIHTKVMEDVEQRISTNVPGMIQSTVAQQTAAQNIEHDFYGAYPEFRDMEPTVVATAQQIMAETGIRQYSQALRDEVARRLAPLRPTVLQRLQQPQAQNLTQAMPQPAPSLQQHVQVPQAAPVPAQAQLGQVVPTLVRDASGQLVPLTQYPQQYMPGPAQMPAQGGVPNEVTDIWGTLGY